MPRAAVRRIRARGHVFRRYWSWPGKQTAASRGEMCSRFSIADAADMQRSRAFLYQQRSVLSARVWSAGGGSDGQRVCGSVCVLTCMWPNPAVAGTGTRLDSSTWCNSLHLPFLIRFCASQRELNSCIQSECLDIFNRASGWMTHDCSGWENARFFICSFPTRGLSFRRQLRHTEI